jgi:hypothetical protein
MKGDSLPKNDHIARYCKPKTAPDGQPTGTSFMLRKDEEFRSVNWMEHFGNSGGEDQITNIREHIEMSLAASGIFAVLNVGEILDQVKANSDKQLSILHEPTPRDPSHSGVHGYQYEDDLVADLIAELVIKTYRAR